MTLIKRLASYICLLSFFTSFAIASESQHGFAMHGELKYPADFTHFEYTNPKAPKASK